MKIALSVLCTLFFYFVSYNLSIAQNHHNINGFIVDSDTNLKMNNTTVVILNAKDSTLYKFTRTDSTGSFFFRYINHGKFILLLSHPGYVDYSEKFMLSTFKQDHNFGQINMTLKSHLLENVIIRGSKTPIKIKGDTTEYDASSLNISPNSKVEDLLKQLPGLQIDKDGNITAYGKNVRKVLVDGEEFFGDDPTLVTKNIRGDMVDKIQLYDKKSDQASFTGIEDGKRNKTINIKLKQNKKHGYFGKLDAGIGTGKYHQEQGMFNFFREKRKFAAYTTLANTGKVDLSWDDGNKYSSSSNIELQNGVVSMYFKDIDEDFETYNGRFNTGGLPKVSTGGVHYDDKWKKDNQSINVNYKIGALNTTGNNDAYIQNNLPNGLIRTNTDQTFKNSVFRQKMDVAYSLNLGSMSNLKFFLEAKNKKNNSERKSSSTSLREDHLLLNQNINELNSKTDQKDFNISAFYTKKFKKARRTLSIFMEEIVNQKNSKGTLDSKITFYRNNADSLQSIDQLKTIETNTNTFNVNLTYSEPLSSQISLITSYGILMNSSKAERATFDQNPLGFYDVIDRSLSNNYNLNQITNSAGTIFSFNLKKIILNFGTKVSETAYKQSDLYSGEDLKRHFINWQPQGAFEYNFSDRESIGLKYTGNTTQPNINQIQPIKENINPLNIILGNPFLKPSFTHSINANYDSYKPITGQSIHINTSYSISLNPITDNSLTDTAGKTVNQFINLRNHTPKSLNVHAYFNRKIKALDLNMGLTLTTNASTYYNYSNNALNITKSYYFSGQVNVSRYKDKQHELFVAFGPNYSVNESSLQKAINSNGIGFNVLSSLNFYVPGNIKIGSDINYEYRAQTISFNQKFDRLIVNVNSSRAFFKEQNLKFMVAVNDLFNQNNGFSRTASHTSMMQTKYSTIKRYFLFSLIYDFNKMGKSE